MDDRFREIELKLKTETEVFVSYKNRQNQHKRMLVTKTTPDKSLIGYENFSGQEFFPYREYWRIHTIINDEITDIQIFEFAQQPLLLYKFDDEIRGFFPFELYFAKHLNVPSNTQSVLVSKLNELGSKLNDWHDECPVLDIIDPDLSPNYYYNPSASGEREKYSWFPVDILIKPSNEFCYLGPIRNLPIHGNEDLYKCIFDVFGIMLEAFQRLIKIEDEKETLIQVVVKAQKYVIQPGTSYSGKWHVEGKTENIVAAGVYYCKIDPGFENDSVIFGPKYDYDLNLDRSPCLQVQEGSAIVFSNYLPHKFLTLKNGTDKPLERLFINFFIVNPYNPLESTTLYCEAEKVLKKKTKLSSVLIDEILSYLVYRPNLFEAKEKRKLARKYMKTDTSGWGYIRYGNEGELKFFNTKAERDQVELEGDYIQDMDFEEDKIKPKIENDYENNWIVLRNIDLS